MSFFKKMRPSGNHSTKPHREARREAAKGKGTQTTFSKRKDKVELIGIKKDGRTDKGKYHRDL